MKLFKIEVKTVSFAYIDIKAPTIDKALERVEALYQNDKIRWEEQEHELNVMGNPRLIKGR